MAARPKHKKTKKQRRVPNEMTIAESMQRQEARDRWKRIGIAIVCAIFIIALAFPTIALTALR